MQLYNLRLSHNNHNSTITVSINSETLGKKELWFSTEQKYEDAICSDNYDAFLVGLLYPAMKYGEDIHIAGSVSKKLLFNINNYVIPLVKSFSPSCKIIEVTAENAINNNLGGSGIGTGFSGGVDSFCTIYDRYELEKDTDYKINNFLFLNVGSHGLGDKMKVEDKFNKRFNYLKQFPDEIGLDFIPLNSNLHYFHPWGHQKTHTLTSASGVLILQGLFKRYYYASSGVDYDDMLENAYKYREYSIGEYCDPILLPLLSTESLEFISDGVQYTRVEKTLHILNYKPVKKYLNVCVSGDDTHKNCSVCSKCSRTLMTINSFGKLDEFKHLFNIDKYKNDSEKKYICKQVALQKQDPYARANVELARKNNIKLPNRIYCLMFLVPSKLKHILPEKHRKILKRLFHIDIK